ncbi:MAG: hypothetical protein ACSHXI_01120 [Hoeflea sp.]|uniref:hypothetical protein n=1 Tax=Hoeflea sp. TaxID=1940281 RepID=UPI003EF62298
MLMRGFGDILYQIVPKPRVRRQETDVRRRAERLLVLTKGNNPTFSYYLEERLNRSPYPSQVRDLADGLDDIDPEGLYVVVCRYIRPRQLQWLYRNRNRIAGAALFLDDDIAATLVSREGRLGYKAYITAVGILPLMVLNRVLTDVWVSTPALRKALESKTTDIKVVGPLPSKLTYHCRKDDTETDHVVMAFHTGGCHEAEHNFLVPVVRESLRRCRNLRYEVVATGKIARMWQNADLPEGQFVIHSNKVWADYLEDTLQSKVDILLVPLAQSRMNDVRAGTKRIDAVRMGAAAILSRSHVYQHNASNGEVFVDYDPTDWVEEICRLAGNITLRHRARDATANVVKWIAENEAASFPLHVE